MPWIGWFDILDQADRMVLLDTVQFNRRSWQQRNQIRSRDGLVMISVPVVTHGKSTQRIRDVEIADKSFGVRFLRTIQSTYGRAPYFRPVFDELAEVVPPLVEAGRLMGLNEGLIDLINGWLDITTPIVRASDLEVEGARGSYLASISRAVGADVYLSTAGAREYLEQDIEHFSRLGVSVLIHRFAHPVYPQLYSPFLSHASALDLVMMHGKESGGIMRGARGDWEPLREAAVTSEELGGGDA